jgi:hypothetical protein
MNHSPAQLIQRVLIAHGLGADPPAGPWPVYAAHEPDGPDDAVTVFDTAGTGDGRSMLDGTPWFHYGFQVRVRAVDHLSGWRKADAIRTALATAVYRETIVLGPDQYLMHAVTALGDVLVLGKEVPASKRRLFTLNATTWIEVL